MVKSSRVATIAQSLQPENRDSELIPQLIIAAWHCRSISGRVGFLSPKRVVACHNLRVRHEQVPIMSCRAVLITTTFLMLLYPVSLISQDLSALKQNQIVSDFKVVNLYKGSDGTIMGGKFIHSPTMVPVYLLQIETVPQVFMWVDTPAISNRGLAHSLEHLLAGKGIKGRYAASLTGMRLSRAVQASFQDYNFYAMSSGTGVQGFYEQFHTWMDALYSADFSDLEAEREFYHFGTSSQTDSRRRELVEEGAVYDEMQTAEGVYTYYFELRKEALGAKNPFAFYINGVPDEMRQVSPQDIRSFYRQHYRLGPTTGFIFVIGPKENLANFLERISIEFQQFSTQNQPARDTTGSEGPKYPIHPSDNHEVKIYPFPAANVSDRAEVRFAWKPVQTNSQTRLKLLQLFFQALAGGQRSLLYRSLIDSKTRLWDCGATSIESKSFLSNSPHFPVQFVGLSGIPGTQISVANVERLRSQILSTVEEISRYPDHSEALARFNKLISEYANSSRRSESIWIRSAPLFGTSYATDWKEYLEYLEMDPSFVRSLSEDRTWENVQQSLSSGSNIWRDLIRQYHLLDAPYATASMPSPQLLQEVEASRQRRLRAKAAQLMQQFGVKDEQEAISRFEQQDAEKTKVMAQLDTQIRRPHFTEHPPLTHDDEIKFRQLTLNGVPVISSMFERAPTIDVGLSFDLRGISPKYYKYLPILPRCLDSLGLKQGTRITRYSDLLAARERAFYDFSIKYRANARPRRADMTIRFSAITPEELRVGLDLIHQMLTASYLEPENASRLRDLVDERLWRDDSFLKTPGWFMNSSYAFRYQNDPLYLAVNSQLTRAHWDARLKWLFHAPVSADQIEQLRAFTAETLAVSSTMSGRDLSAHLAGINATGLERELLEYWQSNISAFPDTDASKGLQELSQEVEEDLRTGPAHSMEDLRNLCKTIFARGRLKIDVTLDGSLWRQVRSPLQSFIRTLPQNDAQESVHHGETSALPILDRAEKRAGFSGDDFPWYVGMADPASSTASVVFYADFPGYEQLDRNSLVKVLASKLLSGAAPHGLLMKSREDGLAYSSEITSDPSLKLIWYDADRSPDLLSLIKLVNTMSENIGSVQDRSLLDYAFEQTFSVPRSISSFSERGRGLAEDIFDGNEPWKIRRFSEALMALRRDPDLLSEVTAQSLNAISPVLVKSSFKQQQRAARSTFFFVGSERMLDATREQLSIPNLVRLYPSDFWIH